MPADVARAPLRVLLADVDGVARRAVASLVDGLADVILVGQVEGGGDVSEALRGTRADLLVIDDRLLRSGDRVLAGLTSGMRVVVVGMDDDPAFAARARRLGAEAWIAKDRASDELPAVLIHR